MYNCINDFKEGKRRREKEDEFFSKLMIENSFYDQSRGETLFLSMVTHFYCEERRNRCQQSNKDGREGKLENVTTDSHSYLLKGHMC